MNPILASHYARKIGRTPEEVSNVEAWLYTDMLVINDVDSLEMMNAVMSVPIRSLNMCDQKVYPSILNFDQQYRRITFMTERYVFSGRPTKMLSPSYVGDISPITIGRLPADLEELRIGSRHVISLPKLPKKLETLVLAGVSMSTLPDLPDTLERLSIRQSSIGTLPDLSNTKLRELDTYGSEVTDSCIKLPPTIEKYVSNGRYTVHGMRVE